MFNTRAHYGAFNARWLSPEDVAKTFVPVNQFRQLVHETHSILLGPRGCGKTTLLKMLTRKALNEWEVLRRFERFQNAFSRPQYEAVYVPADVRWSYELAQVAPTSNLQSAEVIKSQRVMVSINTLTQLLGVIGNLVGERPTLERDICAHLSRRWGLGGGAFTLAAISRLLLEMVSDLRGLLNGSDISFLQKQLALLPQVFSGHVLDAQVEVVHLLQEAMHSDVPQKWAFCYDELEIAPEWLRRELLESIRSTSQNILLKLTWSPLLPSGVRTTPESAADFKAIRLWSSHVRDPRAFCENLSTEFLGERFPTVQVSPTSFLNRSILVSEADEEPPGAYERGSTEYLVFKELAEWDESFRKLLEVREIPPADPVPHSVEEKDQFFRKIKPIALLRREFLTETRIRTRKAVTLYAGKEAVFALSEGNPRWLLGLMSDLADLWGEGDSKLALGQGGVSYADQARVLNAAARRFFALIKSSPFKRPGRPATVDASDSLFGFVQKLGAFFQGEIYQQSFPLDPIGSFEVASDCDEVTIAMVEQLLEIGALVYIGVSPQDVPIRIAGSRFRLSFLLAPVFRLPIRTFRAIQLGEVLAPKWNPDQLQLGI